MNFRPHIIYVALALVIGCASPAVAKSSEWVEGIGEARVLEGDQVLARERAIKRALRQCVEKRVGVAISSRFVSTEKSAVNDSIEDFYQRIENTIQSDSAGFVAEWLVVDEVKNQDKIWVKVKAKVFASRVLAEVDALRGVSQCHLTLIQCDAKIQQVKTYEPFALIKVGN